MEKTIKKCSSKEHRENFAKCFCRKCKIYMCNQCELYHLNLFQNHQAYILEKNIEDIFTGFCTEENHNDELEYFCKTHNQLCCAACIAKIIKKENGKHKDCDVCIIEEIKEEKINNLRNNIKLLEEFSNILQMSIDNLKEIFEEINKNKEKIKIQIQKTFTKIRNELNNREEELLLEIDNKFEKHFFKESLIKEYETIPNQVKLSIEKSKLIEKEINLNSILLSSVINDCLKAEDKFKEINLIKDNIQNVNNSKNLIIKFIPVDDQEIKKFLEQIKNFGKIYFDTKIYKYFEISSIINNDSEKQNLIINWIKEKIKKNINRIDLIFKMSKNGSTGDDFHKFCDNKGPTLLLIKTTKNKIFGGFTPLNWEKNKGKIIDESGLTFIFFLNLMKKYDILDVKRQAIYGTKKNGPSFGEGEIELYDDMKEGIIELNGNFLSNSNLEIIGRKKREIFNTEEFEVYQISY